MPNVLVVEDESDVRDLLVLHLKREGYTVNAFEDSEKALESLSSIKFDLAILDWMLPSMSGLDLCKLIRTKFGQKIPILMLTARADTMDKVVGLEVGADDYLTKPFEIREFVARVRALLRRSQGQEQSIFQTGSMKIDFTAKKLFISDQEISLTPNEFKLLAILSQKNGATLERGELIKLIQGPGVAVVDRTIDTTVLGLRKKLGDCADLVETVRGFGYRLKV